jgi:hypothetical protein
MNIHQIVLLQHTIHCAAEDVIKSDMGGKNIGGLDSRPENVTDESKAVVLSPGGHEPRSKAYVKRQLARVSSC